jgi:hypothetical protein
VESDKYMKLLILSIILGLCLLISGVNADYTYIYGGNVTVDRFGEYLSVIQEQNMLSFIHVCYGGTDAEKIECAKLGLFEKYNETEDQNYFTNLKLEGNKTFVRKY